MNVDITSASVLAYRDFAGRLADAHNKNAYMDEAARINPNDLVRPLIALDVQRGFLSGVTANQMYAWMDEERERDRLERRRMALEQEAARRLSLTSEQRATEDAIMDGLTRQAELLVDALRQIGHVG